MRESMRIMVLIVLVVLLAANVWATSVVLRSATAAPAQKALQSLLVWLVPLIGAVVVIVFHRLDRRSQGPDPERARLDGSEIDVGLGARQDGHH
jgi:membrane protease YdiL (CAAX protease family)